MAPAAERLSRFLTFLLRHKPKEYPLAMDREGFAPWHEVVDLVRQRFYDVTEEQMRALIAGGSKKRFEICGGKVRATYGIRLPSILVTRRRNRRPSFTSPPPAI